MDSFSWVRNIGISYENNNEKALKIKDDFIKFKSSRKTKLKKINKKIFTPREIILILNTNLYKNFDI